MIRACHKMFNFNSMVVNPAKFQLIFLGQERKPRSKFCIDIDGNIILERNYIKVLGVTIDQKFELCMRQIRIFVKFKICQTNIATTLIFCQPFHIVLLGCG